MDPYIVEFRTLMARLRELEKSLVHDETVLKQFNLPFSQFKFMRAFKRNAVLAMINFNQNEELPSKFLSGVGATFLQSTERQKLKLLEQYFQLRQ